MPAASRALLAALLLRAALGLSDDVLLLQQRPGGPRAPDSVQEPLSVAQGFVGMVTNDDELTTYETLFAKVEGEEDAAGVGEDTEDIGMATKSTNLDEPIIKYIGPGKCVDSFGNEIPHYNIIPGFSEEQCEQRCRNETSCLSVDFLESNPATEHVSSCFFFNVKATNFTRKTDTQCWIMEGRSAPSAQQQAPVPSAEQPSAEQQGSVPSAEQQAPVPSAEQQAPPTATAVGDPHVINMRGKKFDVRLPGYHSFLVVPHGASGDDANLYVWADVTPLDGMLCKRRPRMYITEMTLTGSWLEPMDSLQLSTGTKDFNTPATWGLSIDGSAKLSLQDFTKRLPPNKVSVNVTHVARPHKNPSKHVDTMRLQLNLGLSNLTVGWAFTKDPRSNWLWISVNGLEHMKLGGILGDDDHRWVTKRPKECAKADKAA